jgi:tetratricopeptide (TPR) repeat protein
MKTLLIIFLSLFLSLQAYAAGMDEDNTIVKPRDYKKAVKLIKKEDYNGAVKLLEEVLEKSKYQKDPDILNEYAFALRKSGNLEKAENYYNKALGIDPAHRGALEYLGELFVDTKRIDEAKKVLAKLNGCLCEEYSELKSYIEQSN